MTQDIAILCGLPPSGSVFGLVPRSSLTSVANGFLSGFPCNEGCVYRLVLNERGLRDWRLSGGGAVSMGAKVAGF